MSQSVLVRGHLSRWIILLRLLGPALVVAGAILFVFNPPWALALVAGGVVLTPVVEMWLWSVRRRRRWVVDTGAGFVVTDLAGVRDYRDEQVISLAYFQERKYSEGVLKSVNRRFRVWIDGDESPLEMLNPILVGEADPLGDLINRLLGTSKARAEETLNRGGQVSGDGWTLDRNYLSVPANPLPEQLRFEEISAADVFDDRLCIWRRGVDEAVAKLPLTSRNVHLLHMLLAERIVDKPDDPATAQGDGLGRILFERKPNRVLTAITWLSVPVAIVAGMICVAIPDARLAGVGLLALSPVLALVALGCQVSSFRCHERGVYKRGLRGSREMRYVDVAAFTYSATRHYHNGAYVGTQLVLRFDPHPGALAKPLAYSTSVKAADDALDALRDHISRVLAARMASELSQAGASVWTPNLGYSAEGIVYRPGGFFGRKEPVLLPYERFGGYDFDQGTFRLWEKDNPKPIATEASSQKNFYPGYFLLLDMFYRGDGTA